MNTHVKNVLVLADFYLLGTDLSNHSLTLAKIQYTINFNKNFE